MLRKARRILFRRVSSATLWKRQASTRPGEISMSAWAEDESSLQVVLRRCRQEQRHHLGKMHPADAVLGGSQDTLPETN